MSNSKKNSSKKLFSLILVFIIMLTLAASAPYEDKFCDIASFKHAVALEKLGLFTGTSKGFELDRAFTREQSVIMALRLAGKYIAAENEDPVEIFSDVPSNHWAAKYISYAKNAGITDGLSGVVFGTGRAANVRDYLAMLLRTLGYNDKAGDFVWYNPFSQAFEAGLISYDEKVYFETKFPDCPMTREMVVNYTYQCLLAGINKKDFTLAKKLLDEGIITEDQISSISDNGINLALKKISNKKVIIRHYTTDDRTYVKQLFADFQKENPNIYMEIISAPFEEYDTKLASMIAAGNADVASHWGQQGFAEYLDKGYAVDLTEVIRDSGFKPSDYHIPQNIYNFYKVGSKQYGVPVCIYVSAITYNKNLFDAAKIPYPPSSFEDKSWTYEKMVKAAIKLSKNQDDYEKSQFGLDIINWGGWDMKAMYFGEKVYSDDTWVNGGHPSRVFFNTPGVVASYQKISDIFNKYKCSPRASVTQALGSSIGELFAINKVAMSCTGLWEIEGREKLPFKIGVAAIPWYNNNKARSEIFSEPLMILKSCKNPKEAFKWIQHLMRTDVQRKYVRLSKGNPPSNMEALDEYCGMYKYINPKELKNVVEGGIKYGIESTNHSLADSGLIRDILMNEFWRLDYGDATASEVCPIVQSKVTAILKSKANN